MKHFPIMVMRGRKEWIPWSVVEPYEEQAKKNHGRQSLTTLAKRGGLDPCELASVLDLRSYRYAEDMSLMQAWRIILKHVDDDKAHQDAVARARNAR